MTTVNTRLNILQVQYNAMRTRADAHPRVLSRYEDLIEAEYRKVGKATGLNERLLALRTPRAPAA